MQSLSTAIDRRSFFRLAAAGPAALAALQGCESSRRGNGRPRPNLLYLMSDQHRADCLGCMGNPVIHTPNLDRLAGEGVRFTRAYTSTPSCTPARSAILTGLSPWHHGMLGYGRVSERYAAELPRLVSQAGYYCFGIGKMHWFPQKSLHGFHQTLVDESGRVETEGFVSDYRKWFKTRAPELDPDATGLGWNDYRARPYVLDEELHPTTWTGSTAVEFLENYNRQDPFLLKVSFARPHSPYDPPSRFWEMYSDADMPSPALGAWAEKYAPVSAGFGDSIWHGNMGADVARHSRRGYYGSVSFIDEQVGRILGALARRGMDENTLIIYFADHGDMLGDHNLWRKTYAYESSARIPMLLRWPKTWGMDRMRGSSLDQPVELRDVLPTFLDAIGAPVPDGLDGASLLELVRGNSRPWRQYLDLEHDVYYSETNLWNALTDGRCKYIFHAYDGSEQLFDLHDDPAELEDLSAEPSRAGLLARWRGAMIEHLSERGEPFVAGGKLGIRKEHLLYSPNFPGKGRDINA